MATLEELTALFAELGINVEQPGFYDDAAFVAQERGNPAFLQNYAEYIERRAFAPDYLHRARQLVQAMGDYLFRKLTEDGRLGACIDASGLSMRMLEREGVWSYIVEGALVLDFPPESRLRRKYFWPIMHPDNPANGGHVWLRVPPLRVVDLTLPVQPYTGNERAFIPTYIAAEATRPAFVEAIGDLMENEARELFVTQTGRQPTLRDLPRIAPAITATMELFPAFRVTQHGLGLKYIPTRVSAMDAPLERMRNIQLCGRSPAEIYADFREQHA